MQLSWWFTTFRTLGLINWLYVPIDGSISDILKMINILLYIDGLTNSHDTLPVCSIWVDALGIEETKDNLTLNYFCFHAWPCSALVRYHSAGLLLPWMAVQRTCPIPFSSSTASMHGRAAHLSDTIQLVNCFHAWQCNARVRYHSAGLLLPCMAVQRTCAIPFCSWGT